MAEHSTDLRGGLDCKVEAYFMRSSQVFEPGKSRPSRTRNASFVT